MNYVEMCDEMIDKAAEIMRKKVREYKSQGAIGDVENDCYLIPKAAVVATLSDVELQFRPLNSSAHCKTLNKIVKNLENF